MTDDDDWAPLPMEQQLAHPGEFAVPVGKSVLQPPAAPSPAPPPTQPEPDAQAEQALQQLKQRLAQAPVPDSFVAELSERERKAARRRRAAKLAMPELPPTPVPSATPAVATKPVPAVVHDCDPREQEPWFLTLPQAEQERLRAHWFTERHRDDDAGTKRRRRWWRAVSYGAGLFFVVGLAQAVVSGGLPLLLAMTIGGGLAAGAADLSGGGRFAYAGFGAITCLIVLGPSVIMGFIGTALVSLACYGMALIGMDGEMRRRGGFRDD